MRRRFTKCQYHFLNWKACARGYTEPVTASVESLLDAYYRALETGVSLEAFYATDDEAGELGPVVKIGSGRGEVFVGRAAVGEAVRGVSETFSENRLKRREPRVVSLWGDLALFTDVVWWSGQANGERFASLTRWSGVCLRVRDAWRFVQLHVSEEAE